MDYKQSGVDIDAADELIASIKPFAKATNRLGNIGGIGGFGALFDIKKLKFKDPILVTSTDGVGTKLKVAIETGIHNTIGIDLVAMCVNDIIVQGAEPLSFLDYFATGKLDTNIAKKVIQGIAEGCKQANCVLAGGETAEMPGMYEDGHYDLAGFCLGAVERKNLLPKKTIKPHDLLIGISSSGVHSNGFSLINKIMENHKMYSWDTLIISPEKTIGEEFLTPTKIYVKTILELHRKKLIKGAAHITGGGLTENIPRILPKNMGARISPPKLPEVFQWIQIEGNVSRDEMYRTYNCGIGMVLIISQKNYSNVLNIIEKHDHDVFYLGYVEEGHHSITY